MAPLIVVAASAANSYGKGGLVWERLSWALGFRKLGFDVLLVDQLYRGLCRFSPDVPRDYAHCLNRAYFESAVAELGLAGSAALIGDGSESIAGLTYEEVLERVEAADMLVNLAGNLQIEDVKRRARLRVYVDTDPGLTHLWLASGKPAPRVAGHDLHFTVGENVGAPGCRLPECGIAWRPTRHPVVLDEWPVATEGDPARFTSVAVWRGVGPHGRLEDTGASFGQKADELMRVIELPRRVPQAFELALLMNEADEKDRAVLESHGWRVVDGPTATFDADTFRGYVRRSGAECSVAKGVYVETWSGWFSDRTTRYLASGKPALVQDTGFARQIPVGEGLLSFRSLADAVDGAKRIAARYEAHCRAARQLAEEFFDSRVVLTRFLDDVRAAR